MLKSAMKEQHNFQEGNIVKIQNSRQVEMGNTNKFIVRVKMVITKLVEWVRVVSGHQQGGVHNCGEGQEHGLCQADAGAAHSQGEEGHQ
jgi:hypothetical protein